MDDRITELEREIEALRARLDVLAQGSPGRSSLRVHNRCPVCDRRSVLRIERVADRAHGGAVAAFAPMIDAGLWTQKALGQFVLYVCRGCGLAEWYVAQLDEIPVDREGVQLIEGEPPPAAKGPFR
jgi:hypothetical protein